MNEEILSELNRRNVTRLCHFTKSINIPHILSDFNAILATDRIPEYYRDINDKQRLDGKKEYICCSIEYPNVYYLNEIKDNDKLFNEWAIICIDPAVILENEVLFSKVNAATERGKYILPGLEGLKSIYEENIITSKRSRKRSDKIPVACATDIQAEAMILGKIDKKYIKAFIFPNKEQAKKEYVRMELLGIGKDIEIKICPEMFKRELGSKLNNGYIPKEIDYNGN